MLPKPIPERYCDVEQAKAQTKINNENIVHKKL
jgi:hypothetical protein